MSPVFEKYTENLSFRAFKKLGNTLVKKQMKKKTTHTKINPTSKLIMLSAVKMMMMMYVQILYCGYATEILDCYV